MYTILQEEKNIEGVVKTTYGIKCEEMAVNDVSPNKKRLEWFCHFRRFLLHFLKKHVLNREGPLQVSVSWCKIKKGSFGRLSLE